MIQRAVLWAQFKINLQASRYHEFGRRALVSSWLFQFVSNLESVACVSAARAIRRVFGFRRPWLFHRLAARRARYGIVGSAAFVLSVIAGGFGVKGRLISVCAPLVCVGARGTMSLSRGLRRFRPTSISLATTASANNNADPLVYRRTSQRCCRGQHGFLTTSSVSLKNGPWYSSSVSSAENMMLQRVLLHTSAVIIAPLSADSWLMHVVPSDRIILIVCNGLLDKIIVIAPSSGRETKPQLLPSPTTRGVSSLLYGDFLSL